MLMSAALILIFGISSGAACRKLGAPSLVGMLAVGIVLGPHCLGLLDPVILGISAELRRIALIVILTRAGLGLDLSVLRKVGRPALLLCFLPAACEATATAALAPALLGISSLDAAILGSVLAAVSPAVVVPRMVKLMEDRRGTKRGIPQMILAGASVDDVFVIVLFSTFIAMARGEGASLARFADIPVSLISGIAGGAAVGSILSVLYKNGAVSDAARLPITLAAAFVLVAAEDSGALPFAFSSLIAVTTLGVTIRRLAPESADRLSARYGALWVAAEPFLFVLVGALVDVRYLGSVGASAALLLVCVLAVRMTGVWMCVAGTGLTAKERLYTMIAYTPKATVQAAIGSIPLSMGLSCGETVLSAAVLAIVITAPLGAFAMDVAAGRLLDDDLDG